MDYSNLLLFCERWQEKAKKENPDGELNECFDHFFTSFVVYNRIYNFCYFLNPNNVQDDYRDHKCAVDLMVKFAEESGVIESILKKIRTYVVSAADVLSTNQFYIYDIYNNDKKKKKKEQNNEEDLKRKLSLQMSPENSKDIFEKVLELLYKVRCNMFHGEKEYVPKQIDLLRPLNHILDVLNATLLEVVRKKYDEELAKQ